MITMMMMMMKRVWWYEEGERSDICVDAMVSIWPPIYQLVAVREAALAPNQVNRKLFTERQRRPITHLPWEPHSWHRLTRKTSLAQVVNFWPISGVEEVGVGCGDCIAGSDGRIPHLANTYTCAASAVQDTAAVHRFQCKKILQIWSGETLKEHGRREENSSACVSLARWWGPCWRAAPSFSLPIACCLHIANGKVGGCCLYPTMLQ